MTSYMKLNAIQTSLKLDGLSIGDFTDKITLQPITATEHYSRLDVKKAIREALQNMKDGAEKGAPPKVTYKNGKLLLRNKGTPLLSIDSLLLGNTTKQGDNTQAGEFGLGMKDGLVTLYLQGNKVTIRNRTERWTPVFTTSCGYSKPFLHILVERGLSDSGGFQWEITCNKKDYETVNSWFIWNKEIAGFNGLPYAQILTEDKHAGNFYVNGIFICKAEKGVCYGYNFPKNQITLDRDRNIVDHYSTMYVIAHAWNVACKESDAAKEEAWNLLKTGSAETVYFDNYLSSSIRQDFSYRFRIEYGENTIPVCSTEEANYAGHLGKSGVVLPNTARNIIGNELNTPNRAELKDMANKKVTRTIQEGELLKSEQRTLAILKSIQLRLVNVCKGYSDIIKQQIIGIAEFEKEEIQGLHEGNSILINRNILNGALWKALYVLSHELAHAFGADDGTRLHVDLMCEILSRLVLNGGIKEVSDD